MAVLWRDVSVTYRETAAGRRQAEALSGFQRDAGLDATAAAQAVGLSYPQYNRYLWGRLPLRTDQIPLFAAAYGVQKSDLTRALGLLDDALDQPWSMAEYLRGKIPEADISGFVDLWATAAPADQRAMADQIVRQYQALAARRSDEMLDRHNRPA